MTPFHRFDHNGFDLASDFAATLRKRDHGVVRDNRAHSRQEHRVNQLPVPFMPHFLGQEIDFFRDRAHGDRGIHGHREIVRGQHIHFFLEGLPFRVIHENVVPERSPEDSFLERFFRHPGREGVPTQPSTSRRNRTNAALEDHDDRDQHKQ